MPPCSSNCVPTINFDVANAVEVGKPITLSATANDPDGGNVKVTYIVNGTTIGTVTTAPFNIVWTPASSGTYTISATVTDDENQTATKQVTVTASTCSLPTWNSSTQYVGGSKVSYNGKVYSAKWWTQNDQPDISVVWAFVENCGTSIPNQAPSVSIISPTNNTIISNIIPISIAANATDTDGTVAKVDFFVGNTLIGTDNTSPYTTTWTPTNNGTYTITAKATDNLGLVTTSTGVIVNVNINITPPTTNGVNVSYQVTTNWGTGYNANITIKNNGATPINGWNLSMNIAGQVTSLWNAENYSQVGGMLTANATNGFWNGIIAPNASITMGLGVSYTGALTLPTTATFNGASVNVVATVKSGRLETIENHDIVCYPNPMEKQTSVKFSLQEDTNVNMMLYNNVGEKVLVIADKTFNSGNHQLLIDTSSLQSGLYLLHVIIGNKITSYKLVK